uniref:Pentatricopeptide repeat-containing protein At2g33680-like n=1 Tax=Elaeis guineensis var. tenera TaxID=51953 RepID=A0A6I9QMC2_ELAGV|nr:pentatricopeptide repeat-containing protein At2g33680-like [Elaeis guineensis]
MKEHRSGSTISPAKCFRGTTFLSRPVFRQPGFQVCGKNQVVTVSTECMAGTLTACMLAPVSSPPPVRKFLAKRTDAATAITSYRELIKTPSLHAEIVHSHLIKTGLITDISNADTLIHKHCESDLIIHAQQLFDEMPDRDLVSWTSLISGYTRLQRPRDALETFVNMVNLGFAPNNFTLGSVLRSCSECGELRIGEQLHGSIVKMGLLENEFIASGLISMYSKRKSLSTAMEILRRMEEKDAFAWTTMIVGCSNGGSPLEAFDLFAELLEKDMRPTEYAFTSVLKSCASLESLKEGAQVHGYVIKTGFDGDSSVRTSLLDLYAKFGDLCSARLIYDRSPSRDVVMYTVMIGGYAWNGSAEQACEIFEQRRGESGIHPNEFTFANIIASAAQSGKLDLGLGLHALVFKTGHALVVHVEGALVDMYAKCGNINDACKIFENMRGKDIISCSSLLSGFSCNGPDEKALQFFSSLHNASMKLDPFLLASATTSCTKLADQLRGKQIHARC